MITEAQIQAVVQRIVEGYQPDQIILFGSYAYGVPHEHSDLDLLIIKEKDSADSRRERQAQVANIIRDGGDWVVDFDVVVLDKAEVREIAQNRFRREYVALLQGRYLHGPEWRPVAIATDAPLGDGEKETLKRWLEGARSGMQAAELLAVPHQYASVALWCQVSAEKLLKARLMAAGVVPPPGHQLLKLIEALAGQLAVTAESRRQATLLAPFAALYNDPFFKMAPVTPAMSALLAAARGLLATFSPAIEQCLSEPIAA